MFDIVERLRKLMVHRTAPIDIERNEAADEIERLRAALEFYRDPVAWKKLHDPNDDVRVPDFYRETSFGDTAEGALDSQQKSQQSARDAAHDADSSWMELEK